MNSVSKLLLCVFCIVMVSCSNKRMMNQSSALHDESRMRASKEIESTENESYVFYDRNITANESQNKEAVSDKPAQKIHLQDKGISPFPPAETAKRQIKLRQIKTEINYIKEARVAKENNPTAVSAFIFSLIGFILPIPIVNIILLTVGFVKGINAMNEFKENPELKGRGFAITAIVLGSLVLLTIVIALIAIGFLI